MLISKHDCYNILFNLQSDSKNIHKDINILMKENKIPKSVIDYLIETHNPTVEFYLRLNNKAHKIIKEVLTCENKPVSNYIKIATSLITQATITIEHQCKDDISTQNELINNLYLKELSKSLNTYFANGDYSELVETVMLIKQDIKAILDS